MKHHQDELLKKSKMKKDDFYTLLHLLLKKVMIVPTEILLSYKKEALQIVKDIDKDDAIFIACALH